MLPNGYKYTQPETNWQPERYSSFSSVVDQLISHRLGNPYLIEKNGWSVDRPTVEMEVDNFNTRFCVAMGGDWLNYVTEGGAITQPPFRQGQQLSPLGKLQSVAAGAKVLVKWISHGSEAVPAAQATERAGVCAGTNPDGSNKCPMNTEGDWTSFFTAPVAKAIHEELEKRKAMQLATRFDARLGVCDACLCPMRLKVHVPLSLILGELSPSAKSMLHPNCWILKEEAQTKP